MASRLNLRAILGLTEEEHIKNKPSLCQGLTLLKTPQYRETYLSLAIPSKIPSSLKYLKAFSRNSFNDESL